MTAGAGAGAYGASMWTSVDCSTAREPCATVPEPLDRQVWPVR